MQNKDQQVGIEAKQYDRRLWLATEQDNASYLTVHSLDVIARKVQVLEVAPGCTPKPDDEYDYWFNQTHCEAFYTFRSIPGKHPGEAQQTIVDRLVFTSCHAPPSGPHPTPSSLNGPVPQAPASSITSPLGHTNRVMDAVGSPERLGARVLALAGAEGLGSPLGMASVKEMWSALERPDMVAQALVLAQNSLATVNGRVLRKGGVAPSSPPPTRPSSNTAHGRMQARQSGGRASGVAGKGGLELYRVLEVCSGVGGLSFLCQGGLDPATGRDVRVLPHWAIDIDEDAAAGYQANHPTSIMFRTGMDEVLMTSQLWVQGVLPGFVERQSQPKPSPAKASAQPASSGNKWVVEVLEVTLGDCAPRNKGHLFCDLSPEQCWLKYAIRLRVRPGCKVAEELVRRSELAHAPGATGAVKRSGNKRPASGSGDVTTVAKSLADFHSWSKIKAKRDEKGGKEGKKRASNAAGAPGGTTQKGGKKLPADQDVIDRERAALTADLKAWKAEVQAVCEKRVSDRRKAHAAEDALLRNLIAESRRDGTADAETGKECDEVVVWVRDTELAVLLELGAPASASDMEKHQVLDAFAAAQLLSHALPIPGNVDMISGGPPCQGLSGLNRHGAKLEILQDPKSRLITVYWAMVGWFKPQHTLTEQVTDMFKKEDARYARFCTAALSSMGYQCRIGVLLAGDYGCPQGRPRCITLGARGDCVLPSLPAPTHRLMDFRMPIPENAKKCRVDFLCDEDRRTAHPSNRLGDVLSDLPPVHNYCFSDATNYISEPKTPFQFYLRRPPGAGEVPVMQRRLVACQLQQHQRLQVVKKLLDTYAEAGPNPDDKFQAVGKIFMNRNVNSFKDSISREEQAGGDTLAHRPSAAKAKKRGDKRVAAAASAIDEEGQPEADGSDDEVREEPEDVEASRAYTDEVWRAHLMAFCSTAEERRALCEEFKRRRRMCEIDIGQQVMAQIQAALQEPEGQLAPLRDHCPLRCNADDYLRMAAVPSNKGACFRHLMGMVTNSDGTCCAGHCHAYIPKGGKCGCEAGGVTKAPPEGNSVSSRVENHDRNGWRGVALPGCKATTAWLPTGGFLVPRWCVTYMKGKSGAFKASKEGKDGNSMRHSCYGRMWHDEGISTVVTRSEPHNLRVLHPVQNRVLTIRENARCQGFPDSWVFVGMQAGVRAQTGSLPSRYRQVGNAVAPPMAAALGRCLLAAIHATGASAVDQPLVKTKDPEMEAAYALAAQNGCLAYVVANNISDDLPPLPGAKQPKRGRAPPEAPDAAAAAGTSGQDAPAAKKAKPANAAKRPQVCVSGPVLPGEPAGAKAAAKQNKRKSVNGQQSGTKLTKEPGAASGRGQPVGVSAAEHADQPAAEAGPSQKKAEPKKRQRGAPEAAAPAPEGRRGRRTAAVAVAEATPAVATPAPPQPQGETAAGASSDSEDTGDQQFSPGRKGEGKGTGAPAVAQAAASDEEFVSGSEGGSDDEEGQSAVSVDLGSDTTDEEEEGDEEEDEEEEE
ncbi:hypothetical protein V8C86DRAFT_2944009 [Haematococcus lacustris]